MLEILQYATSGFWVFIGCFLLLVVFAVIVSDGLVAIVRVLSRKP